jgi:hypothetical protein
LSLHPSINPSCIDEPLIGSSPVLLLKVSDHQTEVLSVLPPIQAAGHYLHHHSIFILQLQSAIGHALAQWKGLGVCWTLNLNYIPQSLDPDLAWCKCCSKVKRQSKGLGVIVNDSCIYCVCITI